MSSRLIYGDIGGTKTLLGSAILHNGKIQQYLERRYDSTAYHSFLIMLKDFLGTIEANGITGHSTTACFAVAGPVIAQQAKLTNLPWRIHAKDIATACSITKVKLINDFEAAALAVDILSSSDLVTLQTGKAEAQAMRVVLGAGTGMGVAWLTWQSGHYVSLSTEAGHVDFAPVNRLQFGLFEYLQKKFGHVSIERILSGSGLTYIFNFLQTGLQEEPRLPKITLNEGDAPIITALALKQKHPIAIQTLDLFNEIYGAYAGNLALAGLCRNGVYIAGGIAPSIIGPLRNGRFMRAFRDKGRFSIMMNKIPVHVITNTQISLLGAQQEALRL